MFSGTGWDTIIYHPQILLCTVPVFCKLFSFEDFKYFCRIRIGLASNTATSQYSTCTWLFSHYSTFLFSHHSTWLFFHHNTWLFLPSQFLVLKFSPLGGCTVLRSRSEPRFFGWSLSRFKIWAGAGAHFFGSASEKQKDVIFHCILYIFLYNK